MLIPVFIKGPCPHSVWGSWVQTSDAVSSEMKPSLFYWDVGWVATWFWTENVQWILLLSAPPSPPPQRCLMLNSLSCPWGPCSRSVWFSLAGPLQALSLRVSPPCHVRYHYSRSFHFFQKHVISFGCCLFSLLFAYVCMCMYTGVYGAGEKIVMSVLFDKERVEINLLYSWLWQ